MSRLQLLTPQQQKKYNGAPRLSAKQRNEYFSLSGDLDDYVNNMRSPANKVGFIIQHGYFRASGKFFTNDYFADADINYVCALLNTNTSSKEVLCKYSRKSRVLHKNFILKHYGWSNFTSDTSEAIKKELLLQARQQMPRFNS